jgi:hypothetical protein
MTNFGVSSFEVLLEQFAKELPNRVRAVDPEIAEAEVSVRCAVATEAYRATYRSLLVGQGVAETRLAMSVLKSFGLLPPS